jgi:hypothetical protein
MQIFASEYSLECEIRLKFCEYSLLNEDFEVNIRQYEKIFSEYSLRSEYSLQHVLFCIKSNICVRILRIFCSKYEANDANKWCL